MLNERLAAARMVREALAAAEADLEQTLVNANTLSITLLRARGVAKLPISTGSAALSQVAIAIGHLYAARAAMIEAHSELASVRDDLRLPTKALGPDQDCPPMAGTLRPALQVVA